MNKLTQAILAKINYKKVGTGKCLTLYQAALFGKKVVVVADPTESMLRVRIGEKHINLDSAARRKARIVRKYHSIRNDIQLRIQYFNQPVYVYFWSRDCDCVEGDEMVEYKSLRQAKQAIASFYDNAEGACHHEFSDNAAYDEFEGSQRDRVAEAYENGSNYAV